MKRVLLFLALFVATSSYASEEFDMYDYDVVIESAKKKKSALSDADKKQLKTIKDKLDKRSKEGNPCVQKDCIKSMCKAFYLQFKGTCVADLKWPEILFLDAVKKGICESAATVAQSSCEYLFTQ